MSSLVTEQNSQQEKPKAKKQTKPAKRRIKLIAVGCIVLLLLSIVLVVIAAAVIKPEIISSSVEAETIAQQFELVNSSANYPQIVLQEDHQIFINDRLLTRGKEYTLTQDDLQEGTNKLRIRRIKDMILFWQLSENSFEMDIEVDRVAPELTVAQPAKTYYLLEDISIEVTGEPDARVFLGDKELGKLETADAQSFKFTPKDGENELNIYAVDPAGNKSNEFSFKVDAFQKEGWQAVSCGGVRFPIDPANMQIGYSGIRAESGRITQGPVFGYTLKDLNNFECGKNAPWIRTQIMPKNTPAPCVACDAGPVSIFDFASAKSDKYDPNVGLGKQYSTEKVIKSEDITTRNGTKGKLLHTQSKNELTGGTDNRNYFIFTFENRIYTFQLHKPKQMDVFKTVFTSMAFE